MVKEAPCDQCKFERRQAGYEQEEALRDLLRGIERTRRQLPQLAAIVGGTAYTFPTVFSDQTTGEFKCPVCGAKKAPKRYNTIRHLLSHLGDRSYHPYKCPVEGCDASSVAIDDMQKHVVNVHKLQWTNELSRRLLAKTQRRRHFGTR